MIGKKNIALFAISLFLSLAFLFPTAVQFEHLFESHNHKPCNDYSVHLHEKPLDCNIQAFHFSTFSFETLPNWEIFAIPPHTFPYYGYTSVLYTQKPLTAFLRGPPLNS